MGKVTVITSGKGGTGKSTVTAGLGAALIRRGGRVLLIDCDAGMRGIDLMLGVSGELVFDIADIINGNCSPASAIYPCKTLPELYILPAPQNVRDELSPSVMKQLTDVLNHFFLGTLSFAWLSHLACYESVFNTCDTKVCSTQIDCYACHNVMLFISLVVL